VSGMHRGDEDLHHSNNSHRWIAPPDIEHAIWHGFGKISNVRFRLG
jgi:hypothetical protein